ncbi:molybdate ABC transporter permease subunit [Ruminococcaceae bacterium OttesenSCG-928-A16]|nr:molybdate ABC transporter permease subunit [Ruminococcaceae bacterium OttesenSCG-928-A16]
MDLSPIFISLKTASLAIVITFFLGVGTAWGVVCLRRPKVKIVIDGILTLPMVLPPTVAGFFLLYVFGVQRPVGSFLVRFFGLKVPFSWGATVLAAVVISFPLMYRAARGAFEQVNPQYIQAARTLGMPSYKIFWRVVLPLALPGVASGGILAFARALGEFGATAMIAGNIAGKTRTLPLAIYSAVAAGDMGSAMEYVLVLVGIAFIMLAGLNWLTAKKGYNGAGGGR